MISFFCADRLSYSELRLGVAGIVDYLLESDLSIEFFATVSLALEVITVVMSLILGETVG